MAVIVGVACEVLATVLGTTGKQLVSYSVRVDSSKRGCLVKVAGLAITTLVGPVLDSAAYAFAPQTIIAPLNGLDIVWNTCSAPYTLGEHLTKRHLLGTLLVFLGAVLTSVFGPHESETITLDWLRVVFFSWRLACYAVIFATLLVASAVVLRRRPRGVGDKVRGILLGVTAGSIAGNMFFVSQVLGLLRESVSTGDWSAWQDWLPYIVLICALATAIANIPLMTKGLEEYETLFMVTLFEGSNICVACISGQVVLREMEDAEQWRLAVYWLSVLVIVCGLLIIQPTAARKVMRSDTSDELAPAPDIVCIDGASKSPGDLATIQDDVPLHDDVGLPEDTPRCDPFMLHDAFPLPDKHKLEPLPERLGRMHVSHMPLPLPAPLPHPLPAPAPMPAPERVGRSHGTHLSHGAQICHGGTHGCQGRHVW